MPSTTRSAVVVGLDSSASANAALDWAVDVAQRHHAPLRLVHAVDLTSYAGRWQDLEQPADAERAHGRSVLDAAFARLRDVDLTVESYLDLGRPASVLLGQAADAQLIVVGTRGHGAIARLLLGSTALQVSMHAPCPVVVVGNVPAAQEQGRSAGRVVVGIDGTEVSEAAIGYAFEEADSRHVGLTALHAWRWPSLTLDGTTARGWASMQAEERALLSERLAGWSEKHPDVDIVQRSIRAEPLTALLTESSGAVLTVVGSRGSGGFRGLLLGSVSHALLHHAGSPVAVVRTGDHQR